MIILRSFYIPIMLFRVWGLALNANTLNPNTLIPRTLLKGGVRLKDADFRLSRGCAMHKEGDGSH